MTPDEYKAKWVRQAKVALVEAARQGDYSDETVERIHRRYHRVMPLEQMKVGMAYAKGVYERIGRRAGNGAAK